MSLKNDSASSPRRIRMFKKRVKSLDIFEEAKRRNSRTWNTIEDES